MPLTAMQVFNDFVMPAVGEVLPQKVAAFNGASRGAIVLTSEGFTGDFYQRSFYAALHQAQRRVDRYAANATQASTDLTQLKESGVKIAGGFGPILFEPGQMTWLNKPTAEAIAIMAVNMSEAIVQDQVNTSIAALVAAIENQAAATFDYSATGGLNYQVMNTAHSKFSDHSSSLVATVMDGVQMHSLIGDNLSNTAQLFTAANVQVIEILGRVYVVTDAPALRESGTPNKVKALSLSASAATVYDGSNPIVNIDTTNGKSRIETTMQADYDFGVSLKGYTWDETNGGKSPNDAAIGTGSNWDLVASDIKHSAGVLAVGDADQGGLLG